MLRERTTTAPELRSVHGHGTKGMDRFVPMNTDGAQVMFTSVCFLIMVIGRKYITFNDVKVHLVRINLSNNGKHSY